MEAFSYRRQLILIVLATCIIAHGDCRKKLKPFQSAMAPTGERICLALSCARNYDSDMDVQFISTAVIQLFFSPNLTETIREYEKVTLNVVSRSSDDVRILNK